MFQALINNVLWDLLNHCVYVYIDDILILGTCGRYCSGCGRNVLCYPDVSRQFVVAVEASDSRVGVALSELSPTCQRLHPCAFFSCRLTPAERNYDVGNRLAVKLALEEQWHLLEGAEHHFVVWMDHRNLQTAKRLTPGGVSFSVISALYAQCSDQLSYGHLPL